MGIVTALSCPDWCFDCMYFNFGLYNTVIWAEYGTGLSVADAVACLQIGLSGSTRRRANDLRAVTVPIRSNE
jgi:hypothetical protein